MKKMSIGAVARLTGIAQHTLRKWESRHGIGIPERSETGRRVYSEELVGHLRLIKRLVGEGHALPHLASSSAADLKNLIGEHEEVVDKEELAVRRVICFTESGDAAPKRVFGKGAQIVSYDAGSFCDVIVDEKMGNHELVLLEQSTLRKDHVARLVEWARVVGKVVVFVPYLSKKVRDALSEAGVLIRQEGLTARVLEECCAVSPELNKERNSGESLFSRKVLERLVNLSPSLECECPNHIAKILIEVTAFEDYCWSCKDSDPHQKALHELLGSLSGQARMKFEEALFRVADADGIDIASL